MDPSLRIGRDEDLADQLGSELIRSGLVAGDRLPPQGTLAMALDASRHEIRRAIAVLVERGVLAPGPTGGMVVSGHDRTVAAPGDAAGHDELSEIYEARRALELPIATLAARRRDKDDLERLADTLERREVAILSGRRQRFIDCDVEFHLAMAAATRNRTFLSLYTSFEQSLRAGIDEAMNLPNVMSRGPRLHRRLQAAVVAKDEQAARDVARQQLCTPIGAAAPARRGAWRADTAERDTTASGQYS